MQLSTSKHLFDRAKTSIPGGVNSPVRAFKSVNMDPLFIKSAKGSKMYDVDGNEYIDYVGSWGPMILGHAHPKILNIVQNALEKGFSYGAPTELEILLAEKIKQFVPSIELIRMVNSGTEATMSALRVARGYTKRDKIIKFTGCYHGHADYLLVKAGSGATTLGVTDSLGVPNSFIEHTVLAQYNNLESVTKIVEENKTQIAAIILEPIAGNMGMVLPKPTFLQGLRDLCDQYGIVLIFDEVMTGFRADLGGVQGLFNIIPDITTFGKVIGGGMPVGAYGGKKDILNQVSPAGNVYQAGTLSGNPIAMTAGLSTLEQLEKPDVFKELAQKTTWLANEWENALKKSVIPYRFNHVGSMFGFYFIDQEVFSYEDALKCDTHKYAQFFQNMLAEGIYLAPSAFELGFVSTAHTDTDIEKTVHAIQKSLSKLKK